MSVAEVVPSRSGEYDRQPPQDIAAEQSVLGGMLLSKDAIADVVEVLRSGDFYRPAHSLVFDVILDLYGKGEPADAVTVAAELTKQGQISRVGGAPYLHTLISSVPTAAHAGYYARIVAERAILRRLVEAGTRVVQLGYAGDGDDVDDIVDRAQQAVYEVTERRTSEDYVRLEHLLQPTLDELDAIGGRDGALAGVPTGFADLDALTNGLHPGQLVIIAARPAVGKALALDTPLVTPSGWTTMGEVHVGDLLVGADGRPTRVVAATDVMAGRPCYEVEFSDGTVIVADAEHQWLTDTRASRKSAQAAAAGYNRSRNQRTFASVKTTAEIAKTVRCLTADNRLNHSVALAKPLLLPDTELLVPPYTLGAWLGDGTSASATITTADVEIVANIEAEGLRVAHRQGLLYSLKLPEEVAIEERICVVCGASFLPQTSQVRTCGRSCGGRARFRSAPVEPPTCSDCGLPSSGLRRCQSCHSRHGTLQARLRTIGVLGNKHIPTAYLRSSEEQRRALLAGLLDTDGYCNGSGTVQFSVTNRRLSEDVLELVLSLGYRATMTTKRVRGRTEKSSTAYIVTFTPRDKVFGLTRKLCRQRVGEAGTSSAAWRYIVDVRPVASVPVRCVEVDNPDHLYLAGRTMIPTHNSTLGLDFARCAAIKNSQASVIFSLEMSKSEIVMRLLSAEARVSLGSMRTGRMSDEDWARLARRMGEVADAPLYIDDSPNLTMMEIRAKARRLKQQQDLRLVVVDYMQLMSSPKRVENRQQEVSEISRSLKLLAKELEVPVIAISQLNRGSEQRADKKPMLSDLRESGCLTAGTRLLRADTNAEVTLGELLATGERDVPVWSVDESLKVVRRTLTHAFPSGTKEVFRLRLRSGREVEATGNHKFLTYDGWQPLAQLAPGTRLATPRITHTPEHLVEWPDDHVVLLAHLLGDGSFVKRQPIRYASIDEANLTAVTEAGRAFGVTAVRDDYPAARVTTLRLPAPFHLTHGRRNPIAAWLDELGLFGLRSHEKFIPPAVHAMTKRQIALFLRHLWATDGSARWDEKTGQARLYYASTSRPLVDGMAQLLLRFGILSRIKTAAKVGYRDCYHLVIYGADNQLQFLDKIGIHGARGVVAEDVIAPALRSLKGNTNVDTVPVDVWRKVRDIVAEREMTHREFAGAMQTQFCGSTMWKHSPSRGRLARVAAVLQDADLDLLATSEIYWDEVASIESLGEQDVYDATVLGTHNFIANGIVAHNSLEQDADMVILLYREDVFEPESPRAGEADLIVAKHRNGPTDTITVAFQGRYSRFVDMSPG